MTPIVLATVVVLAIVAVAVVARKYSQRDAPSNYADDWILPKSAVVAPEKSTCACAGLKFPYVDPHGLVCDPLDSGTWRIPQMF